MSLRLRGVAWDTGRRRLILVAATGVILVLIAWEFADLWRYYSGRGELGRARVPGQRRLS